MYIKLVSLFVQDQSKALEFYTRVLGFQLRHDVPLGEHRWLTVTSAKDPDGAEIVLEPLAFEPARIFQKSLFDAGIPANAFLVDNIDEEYLRLKELNVQFSMAPTSMGPTRIAVLNDTCGNNIQLYQML